MITNNANSKNKNNNENNNNNNNNNLSVFVKNRFIENFNHVTKHDGVGDFHLTTTTIIIIIIIFNQTIVAFK